MNKRLVWIVVIAILLRIALMLFSQPYITNLFDVGSWRMYGETIAHGQNPYIELHSRSNYPPLWHYVMGVLTLIFGSSMAVVYPYKLIITLFDVGIVLLIYDLFKSRGKEGAGLLAAGAYAFYPTILLVTGIHGQIESLSVFFLLLCLWLLEREKETAAALALGFGIGIKLFPIFVLPFLLFHKSVRRKFLFFVLAGIPGLVAFIPFLTSIESIKAIIADVVQYSSYFGGWGYSLITVSLFGAQNPINLFLSEVGKYLLFAGLIWMGYLMRERDLFEGSLAVLLVFLVLSPGFGIQYYAWPVALSLIVFSWESVAFMALTTVSMIAWYLSNFLKVWPMSWLPSASWFFIFDMAWRIPLYALVIYWLWRLVEGRIGGFNTGTWSPFPARRARKTK